MTLLSTSTLKKRLQLNPTIPPRIFYDTVAGAYPPRDTAANVASTEWVGTVQPPAARAGFDTWIKV